MCSARASLRAVRHLEEISIVFSSSAISAEHLARTNATAAATLTAASAVGSGVGLARSLSRKPSEAANKAVITSGNGLTAPKSWWSAAYHDRARARCNSAAGVLSETGRSATCARLNRRLAATARMAREEGTARLSAPMPIRVSDVAASIAGRMPLTWSLLHRLICPSESDIISWMNWRRKRVSVNPSPGAGMFSFSRTPPESLMPRSTMSWRRARTLAPYTVGSKSAIVYSPVLPERSVEGRSINTNIVSEPPPALLFSFPTRWKREA
mmetsp:Transcript_8222/g.20064  ORF Transcript_8222/g.20064 Transcript_8222/m.20064 type:complete len:269 (+) Transcript_8222:222-1028(+)